jgi:hypothetical protein
MPHDKERIAGWIIAVAFSAICYLLLWRSGYAGWPHGLAFMVAFFGVFSVISKLFNAIELGLVCAVLIGALAVALPILRKAQDKEQKTEEIQKQRSQAVPNPVPR